MGNPDLDTTISQLHDLSSENPDCQYQAAIDLGKAKDLDDETRARIVDELIQALSPTHQALTRAHAAEALGILKGLPAVQALIAALKDDYRLVRSYSARSLWQIGDPAAIDPLVEVLRHDPFFGAKAEAAVALGVLCEGNDSLSARLAREALRGHREAEEKRQKTEEERTRQELNESKRLLTAIDNSMKDLHLIIEEAVDTVEHLEHAFVRSNLDLARQEINKLKQQLKEAHSVAQARPDDYIRSLSSSWTRG